MANKPFVSIRKWIKWGDNPASENTNTLVLTTAAKYFVDVRIYLPTSSAELSLPSSKPLPSSRLEWGFAGTAESTPASTSAQGKLERPAHTKWTHWVDNKSAIGIEVQDEGDMYPDEGEKEEVIERGHMVNPATGKDTEYEECWVDLEPVLANEKREFRSWVLKTEAEGTRGMLARIGEWIQGVVRRGDETRVVRLLWEEVEKGIPGRWITTTIIGALEVPGEAFEISQKLEVGTKCRGVDGLEWECVESFDWR
ncbi:hypothetical protein BGZ60DRAFT_529174 [Tricladium varicosporioides]|nr:hypothetical protein BGZ60DRAFT_529174 [Hymenoscyphus varicosporioides]